MFYMILLLVAIFAIIVYKRFRKQDEVKKIESDADKELNAYVQRSDAGERRELNAILNEYENRYQKKKKKKSSKDNDE